MNKVYVLGGAQTDFERNWKKEGKNIVALLKEALMDGLADANISLVDLEALNQKNRVACFVGNFIAEKYTNQGHLGALLTEVSPAFFGVPSARYEAACASGSAALDAAQTKVMVGDYDIAIVIGWEFMKTVDAKTGGSFLGCAADYEKESKDIDFPFPQLFGRLADETLKKYKVSESRYMDCLAMISAQNYANAKRNPLSQTRKWFMSYDQAKARGTETNPYVGKRLAVSDCSQVTDGAAVIVFASDRYINEHKIKYKPVIRGYGHRTAPMLFEKKMEENAASMYILPWTRQAVLDAYKRSGLTVDDMDVFEVHDCFTSSEYMAISSLGLTEPGKEYEAIESGLIFENDKKPVNPSGGLIGCGHPVGATGVRMLLDLYKQVTGKANGYQVVGAKNGLMLNIGGSATTNYVFVVGMI